MSPEMRTALRRTSQGALAALVVALLITTGQVLVATPADARGPEIRLTDEALITTPDGYPPLVTGCLGTLRVIVTPDGTRSDGTVAVAPDPACGATP